MAEKPKSGLRNVVLVWVIGLTLGVAAGAATAMLLMPSAKSTAATERTLADDLRGR
jgi:gas vesicle protein